MKILLDTNVVLDLMLEREPWRAAVEAIAQAGAEGRSPVPHQCLVDHRHLLHQPEARRGREGQNHCSRLPRPASRRERDARSARRRRTKGRQRLRGRSSDRLRSRRPARRHRHRDAAGFTGSPVPVLSPAELLAQIPKDDEA